MAGMVIAAFLPLLRATLRGRRIWERRRSLASVIGLGLGAVAVATAASAFTLVRFSSGYLGDPATASIGRFPILDNQTTSLHDLLKSPDGAQLRAFVAEDRVRQALNMSSLMGFTTGIPSASVATNPGYYSLSPVITRAQCSLDWPRGVDFLLVTARTAGALAKEPLCGSYFDFAEIHRYGVRGSSFVLLRRAS